MKVLIPSMALLALLSASVGRAQRPSPRPSILHPDGDSIHVRLLDVFSVRPIANADVELRSDNGRRCIARPCPTNGRRWLGRSDARGYVTIPASALDTLTSIRTAASYGDLIDDSAPDGSGGWVVELLPRDTSDAEGPYPIKLIDRRTDQPIANTRVRIEYRPERGQWASATTSSNALGYVFIPARVVDVAAERSWVVVAGYRRAHIEFAWVRRKVKLEPR